MLKKVFTIIFPVLISAIGISFGQVADSLIRVDAQAGEGIYTLLRRNGLEPAVYFSQFLELNKANLGADSSLFIGRSYALPRPIPATADTIAVKTIEALAPEPPKVIINASKEAFEPLLGKAYAKVPIINQDLKGAVYYLLAGHGGPDPGAIGKYGPYQLAEDEYAYDVTVRLARHLLEYGATVYIIVQDPDDGIRDENILPMDTDELHYGGRQIPYSQKYRLRERIEEVNRLYLAHRGAYQRMLSIHVDSRSKGQNIDVFFYHHQNSPDGKGLADQIHKTFATKYNRHQPNRDYFGNVTARSSLYVIKYSHPPAIFIELGNIKNDRDQRRFVLADNRQALANWISEGILEDYKASTKK